MAKGGDDGGLDGGHDGGVEGIEQEGR
jgi:hypothetical protein